MYVCMCVCVCIQYIYTERGGYELWTLDYGLWTMGIVVERSVNYRYVDFVIELCA